MRGRAIIALMLIVVAALALTFGSGGVRRAGDRARAALVEADHRAELTLAWPVLRLRASMAGLRTLRGDIAVSDVTLPPVDHAPSFAEWRAQPVDERWAIYSGPEWRGVRCVTRGLALTIAAIVILLVGRLLAWPILRGVWFVGALAFMRRRARPGISHGSARWATRREVRERRPRPGRADLIVGRAGRDPVALPEEEQYEHLLLVAPTGAGKTSGLILPNLLREPGTRSLIVTDPKRELARLTSPHLRRVYGDENVWLLDFLDPALSLGYNPLAAVRDAASADLFAQTWVRNTGTSKEPFWDNAARTLIGAAALHLVRSEETAPPLAALVDLLCGLPAEEVTTILAASPVPEARRLARGFLTNLAKNERLVGSVFAELPPRFACLNVEAVRRTTAINEIDPAQLARRPTVLYLPLDLDYARLLAPLIACFFRDAFAALAAIAKAAPRGELPIPVLAYLDEFGTIGHIPEFQSRMATVRSSRLGCLPVVQDTAQLVKEYGREDADTILTNATTKLCLGGVTHDDAEYFSKLAGTATVHSASRGSTRPLLLPWADRGNRGVGEAARPLITPDELRTLGEEVLVVAGRRYPVRARQVRYYQDAALRQRLPDPAAGDPLAAFRRRRAARPLPLPDPLAEWPSTRDDNLRPTGEPAVPIAVASRQGAPAREAPALVAAPPPSAAPHSLIGDAPFLSQLTANGRALIDALAAAGRPGSEVGSTELARLTGLDRTIVRRELQELRATLGIGQWDDIVEVARARGLIMAGGSGSTGETGSVAPHEIQEDAPSLTEGEEGLLRVIAAAPGATSTGWAAELGVSPSRVRQLLGSLRQKYGTATTAELIARVGGGAPTAQPGKGMS